MVQISDWLSSILTSQNNKILGTLSSCNFPRLIWIKKLFIIASSQKNSSQADRTNIFLLWRQRRLVGLVQRRRRHHLWRRREEERGVHHLDAALSRAGVSRSRLRFQTSEQVFFYLFVCEKMSLEWMDGWVKRGRIIINHYKQNYYFFCYRRFTVTWFSVTLTKMRFRKHSLLGEVSLYAWPPVLLVWIWPNK